MKNLLKIVLMTSAFFIGARLLPMIVCSLPGISDSLVCGHNFWILILPGALLGAVIAWVATVSPDTGGSTSNKALALIHEEIGVKGLCDGTAQQA